MNQMPISKVRKLSGAQLVEQLPIEITVDDKVVAIVRAPGDTPMPVQDERPGHFPPRRA